MSTYKLLIFLSLFIFSTTTGIDVAFAEPYNAQSRISRVPKKMLKHKKKPRHQKQGKFYGLASYYGHESGNVTAMGKRFDPLQLSAACRRFPLGTQIKVTNQKTHKSVIVTVTDRGPYVKGRVLDLSLGAFKKIASQKQGVIPVSFEPVSKIGRKNQIEVN